MKYPLHFVVSFVQPITYSSNTNQEVFKKQSSHYENADNFHYTREAITWNCQIDTFPLSNDEWNTKEDTGKSMKNALHLLWCVKGTSRAEVTLISDKIKSIALAIIKLC